MSADPFQHPGGFSRGVAHSRPGRGTRACPSMLRVPRVTAGGNRPTPASSGDVWRTDPPAGRPLPPCSPPRGPTPFPLPLAGNLTLHRTNHGNWTGIHAAHRALEPPQRHSPGVASVATGPCLTAGGHSERPGRHRDGRACGATRPAPRGPHPRGEPDVPAGFSSGRRGWSTERRADQLPPTAPGGPHWCGWRSESRTTGPGPRRSGFRTTPPGRPPPRDGAWRGGG